MRLGTRVWGIGKFFLLVGALSLTFLVFFGLAMRMTLRAREVEVPSLSGKTVADATRVAAALGLGLRVDDNRRSDEKIPAGQIMQQPPGRAAQGRIGAIDDENAGPFLCHAAVSEFLFGASCANPSSKRPKHNDL